MARYRTIEIGFWADPYIERLNKDGKLLYCYLITACPNNLGIVERSFHRMAFETGLSHRELQATLDKLEDDGKIVVDGEAILITRFIKHQTSTSPKIVAGLIALLGNVTSQKIHDALVEYYRDIFPDSVCNLISYQTTPIPYKTETIPIPEKELEIEVEREVEEEGEPGKETFSPEAMMALWNEMLPSYGYGAIKAMSKDRRRRLRDRQKDFPDANTAAFWRKVFTVMQRSSLLRGLVSSSGHGHWRADIDFILRPGGTKPAPLLMLIEGKYDDADPTGWEAAND